MNFNRCATYERFDATAGYAARTVGEKLSQAISFRDFGAVGDGVTDNTSMFQSALDALSYGDKIHVTPAPSHYLICGAVTIPAGVTIVGCGAAGMLKLVNNAIGAHGNPGYVFDTDGNSGISIDSLWVDLNWQNQGIAAGADSDVIGVLVRGSEDVSVTGCVFKNAGKDGVCVFPGSKRVKVYGNTFQRPRREGVTVIDSEQVTVENNIFIGGYDDTNVVHNGGVIWEPDNDTEVIRGLVIKGNVFQDMHAGVLLHNWPGATAVDGLIVEGNTFRNITDQAAVSLINLPTGATVKGNRFESCGRAGATANVSTYGGAIFMQGTDYAKVEGNFAYGCKGAYAAIYSTEGGIGAEVRNNTIINALHNGIELNNPTTAASGKTARQIAGNIVLNGGTAAANTYFGILVSNLNGGIAGGQDIIDGNTVNTSSAAGFGTGIAITYDSGTSFVGENQIFGSGTNAVSITGPIPVQAFRSASQAVAACSGASTTNGSWSLVCQRNVVTLTTSSVVGTTNNSVGYIQLPGTIPAEFRPATAANGFTRAFVFNALQATPCLIEVRTDGLIFVWRDSAQTNWGTDVVTGPLEGRISWTI